MAKAKDRPTGSELQAFLTNLGQYRSTLSEGDQKLLDAMVGAALGKSPQEDEVKPFWYAYNPPGYRPHKPPGTGYAVGGPYGGPSVKYAATPWGAAYSVNYAATPWGAAYGVAYW